MKIAGLPKHSRLRPRVAVGLSGGVDSSVVAARLVEQGYRVTGVFLECWRAPGCRVDEDRKDAMDVALGLEIPFEVLDFKQAYKQKVVDYFYSEYAVGRTPNPDVMCNREIKFGLFYEWALERGFDYVATGHYARVRKTQVMLNCKRVTRYELMRGVDDKKDQSYFLYQMRGEQLRHLLFPIGGMKKSEVRREATWRGLLTAEKPDSQGICFIGEVSTKQFLRDLGMVEKRGRVLYPVQAQKTDNKAADLVEIGEHAGAWFYTIGQRIGRFSAMDHKLQVRYVDNLRKIGFDPAHMPPLYVMRKDVEQNQLIVGTREKLRRDAFAVGKTDWVNEDVAGQIQDLAGLTVRIRHGGRLLPVQSVRLDSRIKILLAEPTFGVAPGQAVVFYRGEVCLGGGVIEN